MRSVGVLALTAALLMAACVDDGGSDGAPGAGQADSVEQFETLYEQAFGFPPTAKAIEISERFCDDEVWSDDALRIALDDDSDIGVTANIAVAVYCPGRG